MTVHDRVDDYVDALCTELEAQAPRADALDTVFIGGGTPSVLTPEQIARVCDTVRAAYRRTPECEWTIEANPGTTTLATAEAWRAGGITRVSIGAQSFDPAVLRTLGRRHAPETIVQAVHTVRAAGFANVNLDLIYGIPEQSVQSLRDTLDAAVALEPEHVSAYTLTLEPATPFGVAAAAGKFHLPEDELVLEQRNAVEHTLARAGMERYEISNYARPGFACRHNLVYWRHEPHLACGTAAVAFDGQSRTRNADTVDGYIAAVAATGSGVASREILSGDELMFEAIFSGLRLRGGVDDARFAARFGAPLAEWHAATVAMLRDGGLLEAADGRWRLTERAVPVANEVALRFLR